MGALIHLGNVLIFASYLVRDILWLRVIAVAASLCFFSYFAIRPEPEWAPAGWNILFVLVNVVQVLRLLAERRAGRLSEGEAAIWRRSLSHMEPWRAARLIRAAEVRQYPTETTIMHHGQVVDALWLLVRGGVQIEVAGRVVAHCEPGDFLGEMSLVTQRVASATVIAERGAELLWWPRPWLSGVEAGNALLWAGLQTAVAANMAAKLQRDANNAGDLAFVATAAALGPVSAEDPV